MPIFFKPDDFYIKLLNDTEQKVYRRITQSLSLYNSTIDFPDLSIFQLKTIMSKVSNIVSISRPDIFYETRNISMCSVGCGSRVMYTFEYSLQQIKAYTRQILFLMEDIKNKAAPYKTAYEKLMFINDYIIKNVIYDPTTDTDGGNIIGVLIKHKARCEGIAQTFKIIADYLGIYCLIAVGEAAPNGVYTPHSWNIVRMDNKYYHIDTTWNLGNSGFYKAFPSVSYFMCSSKDFSKDHRPSYPYPPCTDDSQSFFAKHKLLAANPMDCAKIAPVVSGSSQAIIAKLCWLPAQAEVTANLNKWFMLPLAKVRCRKMAVSYMPKTGILMLELM